MTTTKTTFKRILCVFSCCLVVVFSFTFPVIAVDTDFSFEVNYPNPIENGYDGYFTVPYTNGSNTELHLVYWKFFRTNSINQNTSESGQDPIVNVNFTSPTTYTLSFHYLGSDPIGVYVNEISTQYPRSNVGTFSVINYDDSLSISYGHPYNTYMYPQLYSGITQITSDSNYLSRFPLNSYRVIWSNNDTFSQLSSILNHFDSLLDKTDYTNEQLEMLLEQFESLLETVNNIDFSLNEFVFYYWNEFTITDLPSHFYGIYSRLDKIYNLLNKKGEVEQTTVNSDNFNEFNNLEQGLINNEDANSAIGSFDVSIDGESYSFIWSIITEFFTSHSAVIGLVIALLTLGFIALILNR